MRSPFRDYFDFSRKEQLGLLMLVSIILGCIGLLTFHDHLFPKEPIDITEKEQALIAAIEKEREVQEQEYAAKYSNEKKNFSKKKLAEPFTFDPNTLDEAGYVRLGFSEKQAKSIRSYFSKGGKVKKVEDFKKLYVVNDFMYARLKSHIEIEHQTIAETKSTEEADLTTKKPEDVSENHPEPEEATRPLVDINSANQEELMALRGIGPRYSERIIKYRDLLGGYTSLDQLGEVYGLKDHPEIIADLKTRMIVGERQPGEKININSCEWKDLVRNPYIDKEVANSILAIREMHGSYLEVEEIKRSHLIDELLFEKISPYLTVDSR